VGQAKRHRPAPDGLVGGIYATLGEEVFDIPEAQGKAEKQPDGMLDDLGWVAVAAIADPSHPETLAARRAGGIRFYVTVP